MKVLFLLKSEILNKNITFVHPKLKNMKKSDLFSHKPLENRHPSSWILKRGFQGNCQCVLCNTHSETVDNLLESYTFASLLCDKATENNKKSKRIKGNITETLQ